jgi:hypothetical protein
VIPSAEMTVWVEPLAKRVPLTEYFQYVGRLEVAIRVIQARKWRNGKLDDLCERALEGTLTRQDTDCSEELWRQLGGGADEPADE